MQSVSQIRVGKFQTGLVGLKEVLQEMAETHSHLSDREIAGLMIEKLQGKNYIPADNHDIYETAFIHEYRKFTGRPVAEAPLEKVEIKVLGAGCPTCDKLEQELMVLISETGVEADLDHIRDVREISRYGVMGSPALVINRKVKAVGSVPSRARLKELILEAQKNLNEQDKGNL